MKWFRLYDEILDDPKMMALSSKEFQTWILLLCLANRETAGKRGEICRDFATISRQLHGENRTISQILKRFIELGLLQENGKSIRIVNWDKRQFKSDDVLQRVKRYRNVTVTAPDTDTDTDIDKRNTKEKTFITPLIGEFENVKLTEIQLGKLKEQFGENDANRRIEALSMYLASKGKKYKDHYATILTWARKEGWHGNKTDGGVNDNLFLRTIREENERTARGRMDGRSKPLQGSGDSQGGAQGNGGMPKNADPTGCNSKNPG